MSTNFRKADALVSGVIKGGLTALGKDVQKRAIILAPYGETRESGDHLRATSEVAVSSSGKRVTISFHKPYARRRHFENKLHPSTKYYLANGLKSITDASRYFPKGKI